MSRMRSEILREKKERKKEEEREMTREHGMQRPQEGAARPK